MLSASIHLHHLDPEHFQNFTRLMHPPRGGDPEPGGGGPLARLARATAPRPPSSSALSPHLPAVAVLRGERVVRLMQLGGGTFPLSELPSGRPEDLRAFRKTHHLPFVVAVDADALPGLWAEVQARVEVGEDYVAQELAMVRVLREALGKTVRVDPRLFGVMPLPSYGLLQTTFNQILPDGRSFVFYLTDAGRLWTSLIAVKRGGDITEVVTHAALAGEVQFSSVADAKAVLRAVEARFAPPHLGLFLPLRTWHELVAGDRSAVARAMANRQAVLDPAPPWLLALVGVGAMAEAATRSVRLAGKLLSASGIGARFIPGGVQMAERLVQTMANPFEALGVDPWEVLRWSRDWARRIELDRERLGGKV
jgi:hypothetical protein